MVANGASTLLSTAILPKMEKGKWVWPPPLSIYKCDSLHEKIFAVTATILKWHRIGILSRGLGTHSIWCTKAGLSKRASKAQRVFHFERIDKFLQSDEWLSGLRVQEPRDRHAPIPPASNPQFADDAHRS